MSKPAAPLYWCGHWTSLNVHPCQSCIDEYGKQTAYYRESDFKAAEARVAVLEQIVDGVARCTKGTASSAEAYLISGSLVVRARAALAAEECSAPGMCPQRGCPLCDPHGALADGGEG